MTRVLCRYRYLRRDEETGKQVEATDEVVLLTTASRWIYDRFRHALPALLKRDRRADAFSFRLEWYYPEHGRPVF